MSKASMQSCAASADKSAKQTYASCWTKRKTSTVLMFLPQSACAPALSYAYYGLDNCRVFWIGYVINKFPILQRVGEAFEVAK